MSRPIVVGLDVGTSGVRCVTLDPSGETVATAERRFANGEARDPSAWAALADETLAEVLAAAERDAIRAIAVDGTSGTLLATCGRGNPLAPAMMYDDAVADTQALDRVAHAAPTDTAAHGATSGLAKALVLQDVPGVVHLLHQADWIAARLTGCWDVSDENNALKTGYDPVARRWGDWIGSTGVRCALLPRVVPAGTPVAPLRREVAEQFGLRPTVQIVAGTTDGCASFLATGASRIGDGVTALGSSLTLKILSDRPIFSAEHGIYSHRIAGGWLVGGASNTGGKVLAAYFDADRLAALSEDIDPAREPLLDYYPLLANGERFPHADPAMAPRLSPRPADEAEFLHELLAGIAAIEAEGYARLAKLGAPALRSLRSVGGGAGNAQWTAMRQRALGAPFLTARSSEAAAGVAHLALQSLQGRTAA
ncbi:FGGY-family carbohydrate kinase [Sphingomonas sp.]|uniref:FGGY-family carbohydrate kinase n=1 Tax=Sphingomonas sp. TaxID=28214 RepID=UPI001EC1DC06|nr:FGGY-family carbohydrate kinase [Sphingomonas sp.]MBX3593554.1 FGGY-family carbohydrate kinase [Sphingomonas sp.]